MLEAYSSNFIWLIVLGFIISFILAFGIGANDVANSFGTSVGSHVLTLFQACCMATVFEIAGSVLIGYKVSDTMRKGILDVDVYENSELELMLGCLSTLTGSAIWLIAATFLKMPISGTHSIVGATVGFSLIARGFSGLHWYTLGMIVASWFISPILSGFTSVVILLIIKYGVLKRADPLKAGLISLPLFYGFTVFINVFSIVHDGPKLLHMNGISSWLAAVISIVFGVVTLILIQIFIVPWQKKRLQKNQNKRPKGINFNIGGSTDTSPEISPHTSNRNSQLQDRPLTVISENTEMLQVDNSSNKSATKYTFPSLDKEGKNGYTSANEYKPNDTVLELMPSCSAVTIASGDVNPMLSPSSSAVPLIKNKSFARSDKGKSEFSVPVRESGEECLENENISKLFSFLQIMTATFGSFAHGGNDVSNAIGPLIALWLIYTEGSVQQKSETPLFILLFGGAGISIGLWVWGRRVIQTIGEDLTKITPSTGFTIEVGAALTVLLASKIGLPISTTHCKVGSIVFVGYFNTSKKGVDWKLFRNIIYAWLVTVPIAGLLSAGCMFLFSYFLL